MTLNTNGYHIETGEILEGFLYSYRQLDTSATKVYEATANLNSLIELLVSKGIIGTDELEQRKKALKKQLDDSFREAGIGVKVQNAKIDKYSLDTKDEIDCENRKHLCHAVCCAFAYALSPQDIREGIQWSLGKPFMNARCADGYCANLHKDTLTCGIYERRPAVCRQYSCRNDSRIWLDFDKMIINPDIFKTIKSADIKIISDE